MTPNLRKVIHASGERTGVVALLTGCLLIACGIKFTWAGGQTAAQVAPAATLTQSSRAISPHGVPDGCRECHIYDATDAIQAPRDASDALCLRCHDGKLAKAEDHPVGRSFNRPDLRHPDGFPLLDNKLACVTCHDVLPACRLDGQARQRNPSMLRGSIQSPSQAYCGQCHISDAHQKFNPHHMLDADGRPLVDVCQHCHSQPMPSGISARSREPSLRCAEPDLCLGCHGKHIDFFEPGHTGAAPSPTILEAIARANQMLPLSADGRVVCSTCHNPHQQGLFAPGSLLELGAMLREPGQSGAALRVPGGQLCLTCHSMP